MVGCVCCEEGDRKSEEYRDSIARTDGRREEGGGAKALLLFLSLESREVLWVMR